MKTTRKKAAAKPRDRGAPPASEAPVNGDERGPTNGITGSPLPMIEDVRPAGEISAPPNGAASALPVIEPAETSPVTARRREAPPMNVPLYWGIDLRPEQRPGVPRESVPHPLPGAHWREPPLQPSDDTALRPGLRDRLTAVFSTALPPAGLAGVVRRAAHLIPDHRASHWLLLLLADRIDVIEALRPFARRRRERG